jgi:release factor glutamine methyltransferase
MLLAFVLNQSRVWLIAHDDYLLTHDQCTRFFALRARRLEGEPMAYLLGEREFMGLMLAVSPAVLIPRPETELLVHTVLQMTQDKLGARILDLGTGSGAIAVALAHQRPDAAVWATDLSEDAMRLARVNAKRHGVTIQWRQGSWFEALTNLELLFDVVVSNPPYIAPTDHHLTQGDLRFEPRSALTDEIDGLSAYRLIAHQSTRFLATGGHLCVEHGFDQASAVAETFRCAGFSDIKTTKDLAGHPRVTSGSYNGACTSILT